MNHSTLRKLAQRRRRSRQGMTLTEIMIVVIIMAMIATAVGIAVIPRYRDAQKKQARTDASTIRSAAEGYLLGNSGEGCPSMNDLVESGEIRRSGNTKDPWGNDFKIECSGDEVTVASAGPDGNFGSEDDIR